MPIFSSNGVFDDNTARIHLRAHNQVSLALPEQIWGLLAVNTPLRCVGFEKFYCKQ